MQFGLEVSLKASSPWEDAGPAGLTYHHLMYPVIDELASHLTLCNLLAHQPFGNLQEHVTAPDPKTFPIETFPTGMSRGREVMGDPWARENFS